MSHILLGQLEFRIAISLAFYGIFNCFPLLSIKVITKVIIITIPRTIFMRA